MTKLSDIKKNLMDNPDFRTEYAKADAEFSILEAMITARLDANLTQSDVARRLGTTQSAIARLESGGVSPSLSTLRKYAEATGRTLKIELLDTRAA